MDREDDPVARLADGEPEKRILVAVQLIREPVEHAIDLVLAELHKSRWATEVGVPPDQILGTDCYEVPIRRSCELEVEHDAPSDRWVSVKADNGTGSANSGIYFHWTGGVILGTHGDHHRLQPVTRGRNTQAVRSGVVIAVAMGVMNVTTYAFTILAARLLGPSHYGALAAMMGLLLVVNVVSLGLQATAARRVSARPEDSEAIENQIMVVGYRSALVLGAVCLLASPAIDSVLRLDGWLTAALLAVTVVPLTVMGAQAGVLQGERRWFPLALIYLTVGVGRIAFGALGLLWRADAEGAMLGVALGAFFPTVVGWFALRHPSRTASKEHHDRPPAAAGLLREVGHNSHALLAFFALSNADVVVARTVLNEQQAGLYAGGLILAKAVLFLPQFVVVIAFPAMAATGKGRNTLLRSLGLVLAIGVVTVAGAAVLSGLAVVFVGGPAYADLQSKLWAFAGLGTLLAMLQLMVYNVVAKQHQRSVFVIWAGLVVLLGVAPFVHNLTLLLGIVAGVDGTLLVVLLLLSLRGGSAHDASAVETLPDQSRSTAGG